VKHKRQGKSLLAAAYRCGVPIYTSSPGDSSIGMNIAALQLEGCKVNINPFLDVNQTAAIVWNAKAEGGASGVFILAAARRKTSCSRPSRKSRKCWSPGSRPRLLPAMHRRRPDTGGLSGATPSEAMTWGKVDPTNCPTP